MKSVLLILLLVFAVGCATNPEGRLPIRDVVTGAWGVTNEECQTNPRLYSFSRDGALMYLWRADASESLSGAVKNNTTTYQIIGQSDVVLRTVIEGESRRTSFDLVVTWDLILIDKDSFCWRRGDWEASDCTAPRFRCEPMT